VDVIEWSRRREPAHKIDFLGTVRGVGVERVMGIEPTLAAWEAAVLPLNYTRIVAKILGCHRRVGKYISLHFSLHFLQLCGVGGHC
jgi:hypothetical protein